ncbi:MAG: aminotransferase class I/II-fold pyridoxal phosphate-dependent enzyme [Ruminococcus sp.]|nr:aminotransferase class I/II-fold pyridoxal phosphate-dependent enzyme [Ruminococcus sp.]
MMEKTWKKNFLNIEPYTAGEQPKNASIIKLNANECPYPPSPEVQRVISSFKSDTLRQYPSMDASPLRRAIARRLSKANGIELTEKNIFVGNGSDDVLATAFRAFFNGDKPILFPDVTYSFYPVWCELFKIDYKTVPVSDDFEIDVKGFYPENGGVVIPNPNAPTSIAVGKDFIVDLLEHNRDCVVIIDEAYVDFGCYSAVELTKRYENMLVTQTFSKSRAMAGMRIGMAIGSPDLIAMLDAVKDSYNSYPIDKLAIEAGIAAINDEAYFKEIVGRVTATRERIANELKELGFNIAKSSTNFFFAEHKSLSAREIFEHLRSRGIYVRYWDKPKISNRLRITIGTDYDMDKLVEALKELI